MQYLLHDYPQISGLLSREDLRSLVENGSIDPRGCCTDVRSRQVLRVAEVLQLNESASSPWSAGALRAGGRAARGPGYQELAPDQDPHWPQPSSPAPRSRGPRDEQGGDAREQWLYFSHPSWAHYWKVVGLALAAEAGAVAFLSREEGYALFCFLLGGTLFLWAFVRRRCHDYLITADRIEHRWGLLGQNSREILIRDIRSLDVKQRGLSGLFGFGSLEILSSQQSGACLSFEKIWRPHRVKELIRELQRRPENGWAQGLIQGGGS